MKEEELHKVRGGGLNTTYLNVLIRGCVTLYDLGKALGSAIKYAIKGKRCS